MSESIQPEFQKQTVLEPPADIRLPFFERYQGLSITIALLIAIVLFTVAVPGVRFIRPTNLLNIMGDSSEILIMAVAMTFILVAAGIDLSIGSILVLASVIAAITMARFSGTPEQVLAFQYPNAHIGIPIGVLAGILTGGVCGFINGILIARLRINPFIVTLGTLGIFLGAALVITGGRNTPYVPPQLQQVVGAARVGGIVPVPMLLALLVALLGWIALSRTRFGKHTYAVGANIKAARLAGINVEKHLIKLYTLSGLCAGLAGVIDVARFSTTSVGYHANDNLQAIAAVVLGGTSLFGGVGGMGGTIIGAFFPSVLYNGFIQLGLQPFWQGIVIGTVLIAAVYYDTVRRRKYRQDE